MFDALPSVDGTRGEHIVFDRVPFDHIGPDHYWAFQPIMVADSKIGRRLGWLRHWGGHSRTTLSALGEQLIEAGTIDPATAIF